MSDVHVRFRERLEGKFLGATRLKSGREPIAHILVPDCTPVGSSRLIANPHIPPPNIPYFFARLFS